MPLKAWIPWTFSDNFMIGPGVFLGLVGSHYDESQSFRFDAHFGTKAARFRAGHVRRRSSFDGFVPDNSDRLSHKQFRFLVWCEYVAVLNRPHLAIFMHHFRRGPNKKGANDGKRNKKKVDKGKKLKIK